MATKSIRIGSLGPFLYDDADETDDHAVTRGEVSAGSGYSGNITVVTAVTPSVTTATLTFTNGILTGVS